MKKIYFAILLIFSINSYSQLSKTHYIPPLSNSSTQVPKWQYMYISTPSTAPVNFKITYIGGITKTGTVSRDIPFSMDIGTGINTQLITNSADVSKVMSNKGFIVEAEDLVYVNVRVTDDLFYHAGSVVSKGLAALGTQFRIGAFTNTAVPTTNNAHYTFASILATEDNTIVSFADIPPNVLLINNPTVGNFPNQVTLNRGQSWVMAVEGGNLNAANNAANRDGLIGASITSNKPIAVNCGSFGGTNGNANNLDFGFDQIVSAERTGSAEGNGTISEYIFVKCNGLDITEKPMIVANEDGTDIYLNGSTTIYKTLNKGKYITLNDASQGSQFSGTGSLYVKTSKKAFAYQGIGGTANQANQDMRFVPPLSCETPKNINDIPLINEVGGIKDFVATVNIVTGKGAVLKFIINGTTYPITALPSGVTLVQSAAPVTGNPNYVTYILKGLTGNVSVLSDKQVYLSYFGSSDNATYGGYYSGFGYNPEVNFGKANTTSGSCLPNTKLSVSELSSFEQFQWNFNGSPIPGANSSSYTPTAPGLYSVVGNMTGCSILRTSVDIPVSVCLTYSDNDNISDNADIDNDNDGIANCDESLGAPDLDVSGNTGSINTGTYSNTFIKTVTVAGDQNSIAVGGNDGTIISQITKGLANSVTQTFSFAKPISLALEYVKPGATNKQLDSKGDFVLEVPNSSTILVLNPDNQLLIDTDYDGIYESGVTQFSSYKIRFRLNGANTPLTAGTGTFKFVARFVSSLSLTHKNLSETANNNAPFKLSPTCLPKDSDGDGIADEFDIDDDNDGIPTLIEVLGKKYSNVPFADANSNGMNDAYEPGLGTLDSDGDGVADYLDLDSDNDGIYDLTEAGHTATDADNNGIIDGNAATFGANGLFNSLETTADSGAINYTVASTDADGLQNYIDSDSDGDGCSDVVEAGFLDLDGDGYLGSNPLTVDANGKVTSADGYATLSNNNYIVYASINTTAQPVDQIAYPGKNVSFTISSNADNYQWQVSKDGISYTDITDDGTYSGSKTATLQLANVTIDMNGYKYEVLLRKNGNSCGAVSSAATLKLVVTSAVDFAKCDDDTDGYVVFNLKEKEAQISVVYTDQTFVYYSSVDAALAKDSKFEIANPQAYNNSSGNTVYVRVENADGTFTISQINLIISATQIPAGTVWNLSACDDYIDAANDDTDGISTFDFQSVTDKIIASLPGNATYFVKYYKNKQDAVAENDAAGNSLEISNINNYRNIGYPKSQTVWVRILSNIENACVGLGPYLILTVNPLPDIELNHKDAICSGNSVTINAGLSGTQSDYSYQWSQDGQPMPSAQDYSLTADSSGIYTCVVKDLITGCENTRTVTVADSKAATIDSVSISDLSTNNKIIVTASGLGDYEYSLDNESGPFQDSNVFENVAAGFYVVYVNDKNGCGTVPKDIAVVGAPPYFTPNGDGIHELWKFEGISADYLKNSKVEIYDRYGKLIYFLQDATSQGWDGTFNGSPLPSSDYWFAAYPGRWQGRKGAFFFEEIN